MFETIEVFHDSSHFTRSLLRCTDCGQFYFYDFYEYVDFLGGTDKIYVSYTPIEKGDAERLKDNLPIELLAEQPQIHWDYDHEHPVWFGRS